MVRQRLASRLVLSHFLVVALGLGVAGTGLLSQSRRYFIKAERRSLLVQARVAARACDDECLSSRNSSANLSNSQLPSASNVKQSQSNDAGNISITGEVTSQVSAALPTNVKVFRTGDTSRSTLVAKALAGKEATGSGSGTFIVAVPIRRSGSIVGAVEVTGSLHDVDAVLGDLRRQGIIAISIGSLAALIFGLWRARSISQPLRELTSASRAIADGSYDELLPQPKGHDEMAELTQTFGIMRDRVKNELAIRNAFVADASHELRSPLTAIRGAVEILQNGGIERPEVRDRFLTSLGRETDRLLNLVDSLLDLEANEHHPAPHDVIRLDELAAQVVDDFQVLAAERRTKVVLGEQHEVIARGDAERLRQILVILLDNAINHSPVDGVITICTQMITERKCRVTVEDQGPGIAEADRERVFDRFFRLDESRDRFHGGAGLGLSIARSIAGAHGGTLTLHAVTNGHGTIARLDLPTGFSRTPDAVR